MRKPEQLEDDLAAGKPASIYVLAGPAEFLVERFVRRLVEHSEARRVVCDGRENSPDEVAAEYLVADLFATQRLVHVRRAEAWSPAARKAFLKRVSEGLPPGVRLVLTMASKKPSSAKMPPAVQAAFYWNPFPSAMPKLAEQFLKDHGGRPSRGVGDALVERYGTDLRRIDQEAKKLASCCPKGAAKVEDVARLCPEVDDARGFRVAEVLTGRDRRRGLCDLEELLEGGESPHALVATVATRLRRMRWFQELVVRSPGVARQSRDAAEQVLEAEARAESGGFGLRADRRRALEGQVKELLDELTDDERADFGDVFPRALPGLLAHAMRYKKRELRAAIRATAAADRRLKGGAADIRLAATELVMALTQ